MVSIASSVEEGAFHTHFNKTSRSSHISDTIVILAYHNWFKRPKLVVSVFKKVPEYFYVEVIARVIPSILLKRSPLDQCVAYWEI